MEPGKVDGKVLKFRNQTRFLGSVFPVPNELDKVFLYQLFFIDAGKMFVFGETVGNLFAQSVLYFFESFLLLLAFCPDLIVEKKLFERVVFPYAFGLQAGVGENAVDKCFVVFVDDGFYFYVAFGPVPVFVEYPAGFDVLQGVTYGYQFEP